MLAFSSETKIELFVDDKLKDVVNISLKVVFWKANVLMLFSILLYLYIYLLIDL